MSWFTCLLLFVGFSSNNAIEIKYLLQELYWRFGFIRPSQKFEV